MTENILLTMITVLVAAISYFLKRTLDKTETISNDVSEIKPKVDILWKDKIAPAHSPRQLNEKGEQIVRTSGIREIIDEKKEYLLELVKERKARNAYDAEEAIYSVMMDLPKHCPDIIDRLKQGAFQSGVDISSVLFAGSIYFRNSIFGIIGFSIEDLDKPRTPPQI